MSSHQFRQDDNLNNDTNTAIETENAQLWNADLAPSDDSQRNWTWVNISALWVGMAVCVPAYLLASGLIAQGMSASQAMMTVLLGNLIVLVPMLLIGHAGARYGVPFPVLLRSSFGTIGARLPGMLRGLVACGWFGIQTWVGGFAIYQILNAISGRAFVGEELPFVGIDAAQLVCFLVFWAIQVYFIAKGIESIRWLETLAAPVLILSALALLGWAYMNGGGFGTLLTQPSEFVAGGPREGQFWRVFWPSLTAMVGFWSTLSLNIPDFTRYARSQRDQIIGQALGLPLPMAMLAFVSVAVTSTTLLVFGEIIWDPVVLAGRMGGAAAILGLVFLLIATLTTNLAANVVAPANGFSNFAPKRISFRMGGFITAGLGIAIMPWKLLESAGAYLFVWLVGYSSLLGPIAGILVADYFFVRRCQLNVDALYQRNGDYEYHRGWNPYAILALVLGIAPSLPGFLTAINAIDSAPNFLVQLYDYAWFIGAFTSAGTYYLFMRLGRKTIDA
ncbi:MAG: NCS1 family nucleobase:cation symporter-1 [Gammaproteobacteria bacterium]|nr:NCS1 family nucleobase:cation symporter-1 [Gammaproteobacteria bacterium]